jgi:hypothetical protein
MKTTKTMKTTKNKKKVFPKAHFTAIPKWFEDMYYETKSCCPTAEWNPSILAYRAYLLGKSDEKYPSDYTK